MTPAFPSTAVSHIAVRAQIAAKMTAGKMAAVAAEARAREDARTMAPPAAGAAVRQLAEMVMALAALDLSERKDRVRIKRFAGWAKHVCAAKEMEIRRPLKKDGPLVLFVILGRHDGEPFGMSFLGPSKDDAFRIEDLAFRLHNRMPEHLRPEKAPGRR